MEQFDPEDALRLIEQHHITHSQWVPTMFVRMLKLPDDVRAKYDLSSHQCAIHAAAPCPVEVKRRMIEWWGPIIEEYYSATEGMGATYINSEQTGSRTPVRSARRCSHRSTSSTRTATTSRPATSAPCTSSRRSSRPGFEYHKDEAKTKETFDAHGWASVGDMGYLDDDGYLYLTDRRTFMIVSGGVNIYPQEAENVLITHPKVFDVAVFGIPDPEMGEKVHAVVQPTVWDDAGPELERELLEHCRAQPRALQVPEGDRLRSRTAAPAHRQALQAPAARPLLGQPDVAHRLMEPGRLIASGRDGDIFEFGPDLVLRRTRARPLARGRSARRWSTRASRAIPFPRSTSVRADGTEIVMERIAGPLMSDAILRRLWTHAAPARGCSPICTTSCTRSRRPTGCARCRRRRRASSISTCIR